MWSAPRLGLASTAVGFETTLIGLKQSLVVTAAKIKKSEKTPARFPAATFAISPKTAPPLFNPKPKARLGPQGRRQGLGPKAKAKAPVPKPQLNSSVELRSPHREAGCFEKKIASRRGPGGGVLKRHASNGAGR